MNYLGHVEKSKDGSIIKIQTLKDHLLNAKNYGEEYADDLHAAHIVGLAALIHDLLKFDPSFQTYIRSTDQKRGSVDHSTGSADFIRNYINSLISTNSTDFLDYQFFGEILTNAIGSHHRFNGLEDYLDLDFKSPFLKRFVNFEKKDSNLEALDHAKRCFFETVMSKDDFQKYVNIAFLEFKAINNELKKKYFTLNFDQYLQSMFFFSDYIYSCLLDADRTDATCFEFDTQPIKYDTPNIFKKYYSTLVKELNQMQVEAPSTEINKVREELSSKCDEFAEHPAAVYTLSADTGYGKTLASLRLALKHSCLYNKKRIIYVLPYITIIEQNASVIREKLNGSDADDTNILEFHSNVITPSKKENNNSSELDLAEDNWSSPIVITTMVQFLNTIYGSGTKNRRRFHHLCNAVLIFDEIQNLPIKCTNLFNQAINYLSTFGKSNIILCTATQPALDKVTESLHLSNNHEITSDMSKPNEKLRRVKFINDITSDKSSQEVARSCDEIANMIFEKSKTVPSILGVFNTVSSATKIYRKVRALVDQLAEKIPVYYLSTNLCPAHRKNIISKIRKRLKKGLPLICISTQLIEAGVDISFDCAYRSVCGLDSIIQTAGRCNREGKLKLGEVHIVLIDENDEKVNMIEPIQRGQEIVRDMLRSGQFSVENLDSSEASQYYFNCFYKKAEDKHEVKYPLKGKDFGLSDLVSGLQPALTLKRDTGRSPRTTQVSASTIIAENFEVIGEKTTSVIVPYDMKNNGKSGESLISAINGEVKDKAQLKDLLRQAQVYMVSVRDSKLTQLINEKAIYTIFPESLLEDYPIYAAFPSHYDSKLGLVVESNDKMEPLIF